jgi:hypothetical protein
MGNFWVKDWKFLCQRLETFGSKIGNFWVKDWKLLGQRLEIFGSRMGNFFIKVPHSWPKPLRSRKMGTISSLLGRFFALCLLNKKKRAPNGDFESKNFRLEGMALLGQRKGAQNRVLGGVVFGGQNSCFSGTPKGLFFEAPYPLFHKVCQNPRPD